MEYIKSYENQTILVTGGAGAIGSNLTAALSDAGAKEVIILDDLSSASRWNIPVRDNVRFVYGSVLDDEKLKHVFFAGPKIVYHLAALFANQNSIDNTRQDLLVNGVGTLKVLQYAKMCSVERVVFASSGCSVYGKSPLPLKEEYLSMDLDTPYQITKLLGELYCTFFGNFYEQPVVRTRFFNSFGPGEIPGQYRNVIPNFIYWAMRGEALPVMGDGKQTRDWTYVGDIVDGLLRAGFMDSAIGEAMNLASGKETVIVEMANMVNEITGNTAGIKHIPRRRWDTKDRLLASIDKARSVIGYDPKMEFRQGLERTVEWFRANWDQIERDGRF